MARPVVQPVSGTFELRWQWHRGGARPQGRGDARREPSAVSLNGAAPISRELATAGPRRRPDEERPGG